MSTAVRFFVDEANETGASFDFRQAKGKMFERYTEMARRVIFFARYEAFQFGASMIEPEHLLLGLSREDKPLFSRFLTDSKQSLQYIRGQSKQRGSAREGTETSVELPLAPDAKQALHYAHEESERLGDR